MKEKTTTTRVHTDPSEILRVLVGFKDVSITKLEETPGKALVLHIEQIHPQNICDECQISGVIHERRDVSLIDVGGFHQRCRIVWNKHVYACKTILCPTKTWTSSDSRIAPNRHRVTTRAGKQMTTKVAETRTVKEVAKEFGCDPKTVDKHVHFYARELFDEKNRQLRNTSAIGLDETYQIKLKGQRGRQYNTGIVDIETGKMIELLQGREFDSIAKWLKEQPESWRKAVKHVAIDMCGLYRKVAGAAFPNAMVVVDRFHVMKLANKNIDEIRSWIQREEGTKRKDSPLYKIRKLLRSNQDNLKSEKLETLLSTLEAHDPDGFLTLAYLTKEATREIYLLDKPSATKRLDELIESLSKKSLPLCLQAFAKTLKQFRTEILNWHDCRLTNAKSEAANNNVKRIKRLGYGFKNFQHFRNRVLLCAGKPDMNVLRSIQFE